MEAEFGKYLEERFLSADKRTSGVIRAERCTACIVHVITLISSAHACPEVASARVESRLLYAPRACFFCLQVDLSSESHACVSYKAAWRIVQRVFSRKYK